MDRKGFGKKRLWPVLRYYPGKLSGGTEGNHGTPLSR
jgi:hypothetical protein